MHLKLTIVLLHVNVANVFNDDNNARAHKWEERNNYKNLAQSLVINESS